MKREIERLRQRVKELEAELDTARSNANQHGAPSTTLSSEPVGLNLRPLQALASQSTIPTGLSVQSPVSKRYWEGIYANPNDTHAKQFYGPSSLFYFIKRMEDFLTISLQQPRRSKPIWFNSASKSFASPTPERTREFAESFSEPTDHAHHETSNSNQEQYLTITQEEYFLGLFWQSYHCSMQIVDETAFREHYRSLCDLPGRSRKPSALVDIIVAICMQYGIAFLVRREDSEQHQPSENEHNSSGHDVRDVVVDINDATIAGRWHYYRCQSLLSAELENPTITTLQCQIFSAIYLCNASYQNMAHSTLAQAVRTAQMLGLHLEPSGNMPDTTRELRKRLWWTLQTIESKTCMKLGRPLITSFPPESCSLPSDDYQLALLSSSTTSVEGSVTWLSYTVQNSKLVLAARATHVAFFERCNELLTERSCASIYDDDPVLEDCAGFLQTSISGPHGLQTWLQELPDALKSKRKDGGNIYSTDCSALDMERFAPTWLQRHRLLLELLYHNLSMNLFRPFITFPSVLPSLVRYRPNNGSLPSSLPSTSPSPSSTTRRPLAEQNAVACAKHGIALTKMIHETLENTDFLAGWHEAFQWQWNAALSLIGFILANPRSELSRDARQAIDRAIEVFNIFGRHFAVGTSAAIVTSQLMARADALRNKLGQSCGGINPSVQASGAGVDIASDPSAMSSGTQDLQNSTQIPSIPTETGEVEALETLADMAMIDDLLDGTINMAYGVDCFGGVDFSLPENAHLTDGWNI
ncbi:Proline utilization trans-activator [Cytospora mali]|uniref:Proline utilization trans-activator n=1 Tax=Cytospora mali TaxID=578113 RepID=A0A194W8Q7_CYTMA|nr:Proline utilization trans-activator [Valsa mali]